MQTVSPRIWTQMANFISYDDKHAHLYLKTKYKGRFCRVTLKTGLNNKYRICKQLKPSFTLFHLWTSIHILIFKQNSGSSEMRRMRTMIKLITKGYRLILVFVEKFDNQKRAFFSWRTIFTPEEINEKEKKEKSKWGNLHSFSGNTLFFFFCLSILFSFCQHWKIIAAF